MKLTQLPIPLAEIDEILDSPIPYTKDADQEEEKKCQVRSECQDANETSTTELSHYSIQDLLATLSPEQIEIAAQSSYAYWLKSMSVETPAPTENQRTRMALREMRRHLFKVASFDLAVKNLADAIENRQTNRVDLMRACFLEGVEYESPEEEALAAEFRKRIQSDLERQSGVVRGLDKEGRSMIVIRSRTESPVSEDEFVTAMLYIMERAIATVEYASKGAIEKMTVVFDFGKFSASRAPSIAALKRLASTLQHSYPERLKKLVIIDAAFWMRATYGLIQPFLDPETKKKFVMVSGDKQKVQTLTESIDEANAAPWMIPGGKFTEEVVLGHFLEKVPFHMLYDDMPVSS